MSNISNEDYAGREETEPKEPAVDREKLKFQAWVHYLKLKAGMRIIEPIYYGPGDWDYWELPCIVTSVEFGEFSSGEFVFRCNFSYRVETTDGELIEQSSLMVRDVEIAAGDDGFLAYFESEEEAASFGVQPCNLEPAKV